MPLADHRTTHDASGRRNTAAMEALTDGIFAVAMTILVLDLHDPGQALPASLGQMWPRLLAYFASFTTLLVMWVGHHQVFAHARHVDPALMFTNGFTLLFVTFVPFATSLVANHMGSPDERWAGSLYALTWAAYAVTSRPFVWALGRGWVDNADLKRVRVSNWISLIVYVVAAGIALVTVIGGILAVLAVTAFWTFEAFRRHARIAEAP